MRIGTRAYDNSFKPVANCIPGPNLRRLRVGLHVEREPFRHHLVHLGRRAFVPLPFLPDTFRKPGR